MRWSSRPSATCRSCLPSRFNYPVDVFRSARQRACDERAFVLDAVGIENEIELDGEAYAVRVEAPLQALALHHLWQYEQERGAVRLVEPEVPVQPHAWRGALVYALFLLTVPLVVAQGWLPQDPYSIGVMDPVQIRAGQWWRGWTALTLHWDATHLLGNLLAGMLLGYAAGQIWGNGRAWALIILAAAAANLLEAGFGYTPYVSAGASTAVFAALGLVAAWSWRTRRRYAHNWMRRLVPLVAGIAVLALLGGGDGDPAGIDNTNDNTNVLSHALGFVMGALAGMAVASERGARWLGALSPWAASVIATGQVVMAWIMAVAVN
jgi:rhomboid protease GluP